MAAPGAGASGEDADHEVVRQREQPPLDQDQTAGELGRIRDLEPRRVVRVVGEAERRVAIGAERVVGVEGDDGERHEGDHRNTSAITCGITSTHLTSHRAAEVLGELAVEAERIRIPTRYRVSHSAAP